MGPECTTARAAGRYARGRSADRQRRRSPRRQPRQEGPRDAIRRRWHDPAGPDPRRRRHRLQPPAARPTPAGHRPRVGGGRRWHAGAPAAARPERASDRCDPPRHRHARDGWLRRARRAPRRPGTWAYPGHRDLRRRRARQRRALPRDGRRRLPAQDRRPGDPRGADRIVPRPEAAPRRRAGGGRPAGGNERGPGDHEPVRVRPAGCARCRCTRRGPRCAGPTTVSPTSSKATRIASPRRPAERRSSTAGSATRPSGPGATASWGVWRCSAKRSRSRTCWPTANTSRRRVNRSAVTARSSASRSSRTAPPAVSLR